MYFTCKECKNEDTIIFFPIFNINENGSITFEIDYHCHKCYKEDTNRGQIIFPENEFLKDQLIRDVKSISSSECSRCNDLYVCDVFKEDGRYLLEIACVNCYNFYNFNFI